MSASSSRDPEASADASAGGVRLALDRGGRPEEVDALLFEALAEIPSSWSADASGVVSVWVAGVDEDAARRALEGAGLAVTSSMAEAPKDWVAFAAGLRKAVAVGRFLFDPHDGADATPAGTLRRVHLPAARAFGTGSHESTRLAVRLLLATPLAGARVLDIGCGAGTLALVASLEGARVATAFDLDADAAFATREHALRNGVARVHPYAGSLAALRRDALPFDVVVANMLHEELEPLLPDLRGRVAPGGRLLTSGQLGARRDEWRALLQAHGFEPVRFEEENEWLGTDAVRR